MRCGAEAARLLREQEVIGSNLVTSTQKGSAAKRLVICAEIAGRFCRLEVSMKLFVEMTETEYEDFQR